MPISPRTALRSLGLSAVITLSLVAFAQGHQGPPSSQPTHPHLKPGQDKATWAQARRVHNAQVHGLDHQKFAKATHSHGKRIHKGVYRTGKDDTQTTIRYRLTETETRGEPDRSLELTDENAGVTATLSYMDEQALGTITVADQILTLGFNPDGTVSVGETPYQDIPTAAWAAVHEPVFTTMTADMGAVMVEIMGQIALEVATERGNSPTDPPSIMTIEIGCDMSAGC